MDRPEGLEARAMTTPDRPAGDKARYRASRRLSAYLRSGHKTVEGWLTPGAVALIEAIYAMQEADGIVGPVGEIGVHHGKLFILLYLLCRGEERAVAVDLFEHQEKNLDASGRGDEQQFRRNLEAHARDAARLRIIAGDSTELAPADLLAAAGGRFCLFSVDGGHTPEITTSDLALAGQTLAEGGVLILDDYFNEEWPGVSEGTNRFFAQGARIPLIPFAIGGNKLLFTTDRAHAACYIERLLRVDLDKALRNRYLVQRKMTKLFGYDVLTYRFFPVGVRQRLSRVGLWRRMRETALGRRIRRAANRLS
jgi:Methyltransferase domain